MLPLTVFPIHFSIPLVAFPMKNGPAMRNITESSPWRTGEFSKLDKLPCQSQNIQADEAQRQGCELHHDRISSEHKDGNGMVMRKE